MLRDEKLGRLLPGRRVLPAVFDKTTRVSVDLGSSAGGRVSSDSVAKESSFGTPTFRRTFEQLSQRKTLALLLRLAFPPSPPSPASPDLIASASSPKISPSSPSPGWRTTGMWAAAGKEPVTANGEGVSVERKSNIAGGFDLQSEKSRSQHGAGCGVGMGGDLRERTLCGLLDQLHSLVSPSRCYLLHPASSSPSHRSTSRDCRQPARPSRSVSVSIRRTRGAKLRAANFGPSEGLVGRRRGFLSAGEPVAREP